VQIDFGIWDHFERRRDVPVPQQYREKIALLREAEGFGFYCYHIAEHHLTPLDLAPSPNVFLAAVAQATSRLRVGSMVHILPLYHPVRLVQEICMLDNISDGRIDFGIGRGARSIEHEWSGIDPDESRQRSEEILAIVVSALSTGNLAYRGEFYRIADAPLDVHPVQKPYPPIWYAGGWEFAGRNGLNFLGRSANDLTGYWGLWEATRQRSDRLNPTLSVPRAGINRQIVVRETDAQAEAIARRAQAVHARNFNATSLAYPGGRIVPQMSSDIDDARTRERVLFGSPATVRAFLERIVDGVQDKPSFYFTAAIQWGDITHDEALESMRLFARSCRHFGQRRQRQRCDSQRANGEAQMIKRFSTLYAGQVDHEDLGFDATPVNERWYSNDHLSMVFETAQQMASAMDRLGFDTLWMAEHHFQREGYECIPNILMFAVHLSHLTERLRFGCGFNIAPMWHPLRLAEDYAVADLLTGGRVRFGVGRGYHTREVETFGAPMLDADANRDLFEEQIEIILKAFREPSFSHQGIHYTFPPPVPYRGYELKEITLVPRPQTVPAEIWQPIVSASQRGLDFMVEHGINGIVGGGAASTQIGSPVVEAWREALARRGMQTELGGNLIFGLSFYIADSEDRAFREATPILEEYQKMFAPLGFVRGITDEQIAMVADRRTAREAGLANVRDQGWTLGPPERLVERLLELEAAYPGLEEVNVGQPVGTPRRILLEQLELFGRHVLPAFRSAQAAARAPAAGD